ncbi:hypothetical protein DH2020_047170 [Rehmannia glutinosa]|uniref:Transposase (putative) gypsy type domain-containing protein n=1 Tax=Rehmannia glutinosa TaxID=99300 RepID=A0ABR0U9Q6_REHGL
MGSRSDSNNDPANSSSSSSGSSSSSSSSSDDVTGPLQALPINTVPFREVGDRSPSRSGSRETLSDFPQDSWELIKSKVRPGEDSQISHRYFIPSEYRIIIPGRDDRMHRPPENCFALHLATLDAGLRFPLHEDLEGILVRLGLCLTQFAPNAIRQILGFIVLMKHFKVAPSAAHFWSLFSITTSTRTNDRGFFYLTSRPHSKFLTHLPSSSGNWKERFIFIEAPPDRPWKIPRTWRFSKPRVRASDLGECSWATDFVSKKLTTHLYDIRALLKEEVLSAVGLSPAVVPRTQSLGNLETHFHDYYSSCDCPDSCFLTHTGMSVNASLVAKVIKEQKERLIAAARSSGLALPPSPSVHSSEPIPSAPAVLPSGEARSSEPDLEAGGSSDPKGKGKSKSKKDKTRSRSGSKSKGSDGALAREEAQAETSRPPKQFSGSRLIPKWNISPESSILKTRAGEDSLELYQGCILPQDQFALGVMPDTKLEEIAAHDLMRAANVTHNLTLRSHHWRVRCQDAEASVERLEKEKQAIEAKTKAEYDSRIRQIMANLAELEARVKYSEESLQTSRGEVARLTRESRDSFIAGQEAGKREALNSPEFTQKLRDARIAGARDFKNSPIFDRLVVEKAAEFEVMGFFKCQSQIFKLGGFKTDFDPSKLDPELDGNGEKAPIVEEENEDLGDHEFDFLLPGTRFHGEEVPPRVEAHEGG